MPGGIKLLFAAVILSQPLQYMVRAKYGEPYPALIMPSFAGTMTDRDGNVRFSDATCEILFRDGQTASLTPNELLSQAAGSHQAAIMSYVFGLPSSSSDTWPPGSLKARLFPGRALSRVRSGHREVESQTKDWLRRRLREIYPSREPQMVRFIWYDDVFNVNQVSHATREPFGIREVRLP